MFFPKGGTGALVRALVKLFLELGGEIRFNSEVSEIMTERSQVAGVVTKEGRKEGFDLVISNADVFHTYDVLLKREPRVEVYAQESRRDELQYVSVPDLFRYQPEVL